MSLLLVVLREARSSARLSKSDSDLLQESSRPTSRYILTNEQQGTYQSANQHNSLR
jgi:hypothetical protein